MFWADGNGERKTKKSALVIGRQKTRQMESPVYVFKEDVQVIRFTCHLMPTYFSSRQGLNNYSKI